MSILSASSLPLRFTVLCFLSLAHYSVCSPVDVIGENPLVESADASPVLAARATLPVNTSATNLGAPVANCASLPDYAEWFQPSQKFDNGDCIKAIELFFNDYTRDHENIKYEFLASGVTPVHGIPTQRVPLKVAYGTCFVVIAMRNMFVKGELPGETPTTSAGSDISSFNQLYDYVQDVYDKCSNPEFNKPGWYPAGDLNSVAIFLWQAASPINQRIHATPHSDPNLVLLPSSGYSLVGGPIRDTA